MSIVPIRYIEPVFRPPSEADSLILPVTNGCSWNRCTFCEMYTAPQKRFRPRDEEEVLDSIRRCGETYGDSVKRVFLADGDAMTLSIRRLARVLEAIRRELPGVRRVSSYCLPRNVKKKSVKELRESASLGLSLVYVGAESGDDEVLERVNKGETFESSREALEKLRRGGDQALGDDPQRPWRRDFVSPARRKLRGAHECDAARISRDAHRELPDGRGAAFAKTFPSGSRSAWSD